MSTKPSSSRLISVLTIVGILLTASQSWSEETDLLRIRAALEAADLPPAVSASIQARIDAAPKPFQLDLAAVLTDRKADSMLLYRVDKTKALPDGYAPADLVPLDGTGLSVSRAGHRLRAVAFQALKAMYSAARADGVTLIVSSSYRSYAYQIEVWDRGSRGRRARRTTAASVRASRPFAAPARHPPSTSAPSPTPSRRRRRPEWLASRMPRRFGFSLSLPQGHGLRVTGYKWESWHYRYIGKAAASLEKEYFGGIQQYLLQFLEKL
jgi:D-alanyl-D-alanine carboxypeptidase